MRVPLLPLLLPLVSCAVVPEVDRAVASRLRVEHGTFRDAQGHAVFLRGVNYSHKSKWKPFVSWQKRDHFRQIRGWGFNCVRYLVSWEAIEPEPGRIDESYLDAVDRALGWAEEEGLYVILDMHQDLFCGSFGGNGMPVWAAVDDPAIENRASRPWALTYLHPDVRASFQRFWTDDDLQGHFIEAWRAVARRAKGRSCVIGYDLINEPFPGKGKTFDFERDLLSPFYRRVGAAIREEDSGAVLFLEPAVVFMLNRYRTGLQKLEGPIVYAPHYYDISFITGGKPSKGGREAARAFEAMAQTARDFDAPLFIGEFGVNRESPGSAAEIADQCAAMEAAGVSGWAYWNFNPEAVSGDGDEMSFFSDGIAHPILESITIRP